MSQMQEEPTQNYIDDEPDESESNDASSLPYKFGSLNHRKQVRYLKIMKELEKLDGIYAEVSNHRKHITQIMGQLKTSRERICQFTKELVATAPASAAKPKSSKSGGGLSTPFTVSPALCQFMDKPEGTLVARAEVTKYIHKYIRSKNLFAADNKQYIIPDDSLSGLLDTGSNDPVHIFDIQSKMNLHFNYDNESGGAGGCDEEAVSSSIGLSS